MTAAYAFLPWLRRGVATAITRQASTPRAQIDITTTLNNGALTASAKVPLIGPGDIAGLDPRAVIRTWPRPGVYDAASNFFPLVEFDQADLPWRYTPAPPDGGHLRPWLCLIVLRTDEYQRGPSPDARHPLASIEVPAATPLPRLDQSWAWAHVQVSGLKTVSRVDVATLLSSEPKRLLARLTCPRRLKARTSYTGFLVPSFKGGLLAGLGERVPDDVPALEPAWSEQRPDPLSLPVYYEWEFGSGENEDFEAFVRNLKKAPPPEGAGQRNMDVSAPGAGRVSASSTPLGVEGALKVPKAPSTTWDAEERDAWVASLKQLVDAPTTPGATPHLAPPLYGRWHAARRTLGMPAETAAWPWFDEVNADPRLRVVAAIGARIVRDQQEQLMAGAWRQVEGIRAANAELRQAQLAREAARRIHARHIDVTDAEVALQMTAPVHGRVRETEGAASTVRRRLRLPDSPLPPGILAPQWRRLARPLGPAGVRQGRAAAPQLSTVLTRLNSGALQPGRPPSAPSGMANLSALRIRSPLPAVELQQAPGGGPGFRPTEVPRDQRDPIIPPDVPAGGPDSTVGTIFRGAVVDIWDVITSTPAPETIRPTKLDELKRRVVTSLDPETTFRDAYRERLAVAPELNWRPADPLEPILAAPRFPQPMIEPLRALSQEWLFPGLDKVPPNSMTVLEVNRRFIHAYMLGLNHEMARELLWRGYPTDQRGTYFRQFWDPSSYLPQPGEPPPGTTALEDIDLIDEWPPTDPLEKAGKKKVLSGSPLVFVLRGDLLARYPHTTLYAVKGKLTASAPTDSTPLEPQDREPDFAVEKHPLFGGTLRPDVAYFAFQLDMYEALGVDPDSAEEQPRRHPTVPAGWYFVLQEQPSEARFGLDAARSDPTTPLPTWDDLAWDDLSGPPAVGDHVNLEANAPSRPPTNTGGAIWARRAGDMALITLKRQVRVAVHASALIAR